jgi:hypothetical protein
LIAIQESKTEQVVQEFAKKIDLAEAKYQRVPLMKNKRAKS